MNSIFFYIAHETLSNHFPVTFYVDENHWQQLALDLWGPIFWCLITFIMFKKKIFIAI